MPRKIELSEPPPRLRVSVLAVESLGDQVFRIEMEAPFQSWTPGDCIAVYGPGESRLSRPYSLSGAVSDSKIEVLVRCFPEGLISSWLCSRQKGDLIHISPPFGYFRPAWPVDAEKLYFATGTGIAPFLSACRSGAPFPKAFLWGLRKPLNLGLKVPVRTFLSQASSSGAETGRLTQVLDELPLNKNTHVYACGLDRMIEDVMRFYSAKGLPESHLHRECFFTGNRS